MPSWTLLIRKPELGVVAHTGNSSTSEAEWRRLLCVSKQPMHWDPGQAVLHSKTHHKQNKAKFPRRWHMLALWKKGRNFTTASLHNNIRVHTDTEHYENPLTPTISTSFAFPLPLLISNPVIHLYLQTRSCWQQCLDLADFPVCSSSQVPNKWTKLHVLYVDMSHTRQHDRKGRPGSTDD